MTQRKRLERFTVTCDRCHGKGHLPVTGVYGETLMIVARNPDQNGAELARMAGCEPTAMNNRLTALERRGLVVRRQFGRASLWRIAE